jgi:hypothetical protein
LPRHHRTFERRRSNVSRRAADVESATRFGRIGGYGRDRRRGGDERPPSRPNLRTVMKATIDAEPGRRSWQGPPTPAVRERSEAFGPITKSTIAWRED